MNPPPSIQPSTTDLLNEIERLQEAKRRALAIADERAIEANELRSQLAKARKALKAILDASNCPYEIARAALKDIPK